LGFKGHPVLDSTIPLQFCLCFFAPVSVSILEISIANGPYIGW